MPILLQINSVVNWGSTGRIVEEIGQASVANGWESYIAYGRYDRSSASKKIKIGNKLDFYFHIIMTRLFDKHGFASTNSTKNLIEKIQKIKPNIIHLHNIHGYYLNVKLLFQYLSTMQIPIVWTLHDCWSFTGHCAHFDYIGCDRWINCCYKCPQKNKYPVSKFLDHSLKNYEFKKQLFNSIKNMTIVPVSYWLGEKVKNSFLNKYPIDVIQNGIDINIFHPITDMNSIKKKYNIEDKYIILGVASRWDGLKGIFDFTALNNIIDHDIFKIVLVGLNKKQIKKIPKEITGIERTEDINELTALYSIADVFLNPTWEDTFPTTNLEAIACGTPVITYNTGGSIESISDDVGIIVDKGDIKNLYKSIINIKEKGKNYYFNNCRKRAETFYNKKEKYKDYIKLYKKLLYGD